MYILHITYIYIYTINPLERTERFGTCSFFGAFRASRATRTARFAAIIGAPRFGSCGTKGRFAQPASNNTQYREIG